VRVYVGKDPVSQAPRQVSRTVRGGKRAASTALAALVTEAQKGQVGGTNATVEYLLKAYLEHLERKGLAATTLHNYRSLVTNRVGPLLGGRSVRKVTPWDLDSVYAAMAEEELAPSTIRQVHALLSGAFGQAVRWGWVGVNPAKMASPPSIRQKRIDPPEPAQVEALVREAESRDRMMAVFIMLAALTGARRGELCALRWTDVDLAAGRLRISRSLADLTGRVEEKATKTHQERTIALGEAGVALLLLHRQKAEQLCLAGQVELAEEAFVFSYEPDGVAPIRPSRVTGFFTRLRDDLGLPEVHLHSLRHFMASQLAARGDVSVRTLAGRLGHADATLTMKVYAAFFPAADAEAADHMGRLLGPAAEKRSDPLRKGGRRARGVTPGGVPEDSTPAEAS
jgi:integrase